MRVRKNSWHYKLWMLGRDSSSRPRDLCRYFWHITLFKVLAPLLVALLALTGVGALIWVIWGHPLESGLIVMTALLTVGLIFGIVVLIQKLVLRHQFRKIERELNPPPPGPPKPAKEPNILWAYLKARKRKMCPLIEVVDDRQAS